MGKNGRDDENKCDVENQIVGEGMAQRRTIGLDVAVPATSSISTRVMTRRMLIGGILAGIC